VFNGPLVFIASVESPVAIDSDCHSGGDARGSVEEQSSASAVLGLVGGIDEISDSLFAAGRRWESLRIANRFTERPGSILNGR
jgi:hypothetical protein